MLSLLKVLIRGIKQYPYPLGNWPVLLPGRREVKTRFRQPQVFEYTRFAFMRPMGRAGMFRCITVERRVVKGPGVLKYVRKVITPNVTGSDLVSKCRREVTRECVVS